MRVLAANVQDVFREAAARFTLVAYFALSTIFILIFGLAVNLDVVDGALAGARLFGQDVQMGGETVAIDQLVLGFQAGFASVVYVMALFLGIFATAHLVPRLQEKGTIDLYLSRPVGRVPLLLSRFTGGLLLAGSNIAYLLGSFTLIVWVKTRVFNPRFLVAGLLCLFAVATFLALAFLIGVATSSTAVSIMGAYGVFFVASILAAHEKFEAALSSEWSVALVKGLYWILPKTAQLIPVTAAYVGGEALPRALSDISLFPIFGSTAAFGLACLALASWLFSRKDF